MVCSTNIRTPLAVRGPNLGVEQIAFGTALSCLVSVLIRGVPLSDCVLVIEKV